MLRKLRRTRPHELISTLLLCPPLLFCQQTSTTSAPCSPIAPYNQGIIQIQCKVDSDKTSKQLIRILNQIEANHLDLESVISKLVELQKGVNAIQEQVNPNAPKITYSRTGNKRIESPGRNILIAGEAMDAFQELVGLAKEQKWSELAAKSEIQIRDRPEWYTPYVFAGIAYANLGNKQRAIELLGKADRGMADNPDYEDLPELARNLLDKLKSAK